MDREPSPADDHAPELASDRPRRNVFDFLRDTTFRSLRHRNYRLYFIGQIVSFVGSSVQSAALMWLMFESSGKDPRWPSWLLVAQVGPTILLGPLGGHFADRIYKPRLIFATQSVFLFQAVLLTTLVAMNLANAWVILALQALVGIVQAVDLPARMSMTPELVPKEDVINAVGLNSLVFNSARAIGPGVAALVFAIFELFGPMLPTGMDRVRIGAAICFGLNSISFVAVLFALHAIRYPPADTTTRKSHESNSKGLGLLVRNLVQGFRYLIEHPALGGLVLLTFVIGTFGWPVLTLMPAYTADVLGRSEQSYYALVGSLGTGALIAALATATFGSAERRKSFLIIGAFTAGFGLLGLTQTNVLPLAMLCTGSTGFGLILYLSTGQSTLQLAVPDEVRGRVLALWAMTLSASAPIGHLIAGQATRDFGILIVLEWMTVGVLASAMGLAIVLVRRVKA